MALVETLEIRFEANMGNIAPQLAQVSSQLTGLGLALEGARAQLAANGSGAVQALAASMQVAALASAAPRLAGQSLVSSFVAAVLAGRGSSAAAAVSTANSAKFDSASARAAASGAGAQLTQGFANGILSKMSAAVANARRVANAAAAALRGALQIHSPSKVTYGLGGFFGEGFADGIRASVQLAKSGAQAISAAAVDSLSLQAVQPALDADTGLAGMMQTAVSAALGGTSFVIPLHVDGVKLGEASIRGINRVTRSAGRLMLEI